MVLAFPLSLPIWLSVSIPLIMDAYFVSVAMCLSFSTPLNVDQSIFSHLHFILGIISSVLFLCFAFDQFCISSVLIFLYIIMTTWTGALTKIIILVMILSAFNNQQQIPQVILYFPLKVWITKELLTVKVWDCMNIRNTCFYPNLARNRCSIILFFSWWMFVVKY